MTWPRQVRAAAALVLLSAAASAASKPREGPEVLVVSDLLVPEFPALRPAKDQPVYYVILGGAERTLGDPIAGEKMPEPAALQYEIARALHSQGYLLTRVGGPRPHIAILYTYGTANLSSVDLVETSAETGETTTSTVTFNRREIAALVGALKADRRLLSSFEADRINEAARDNRLYLFIGAFDVDALARKEKKLLWRVRISIDSRRHTLPESMRTMLASAAPYFATETDLPKFIEDADRRKAEVRIGTPTVVDDGKAAAPPKK
ncbi:MAG: hypothetical protein HZC55_14495 [Verrucomicrobia bacterium]|nr:hypothetical protein [Verrucomicrobiota bacterium]